tara:strand:+ start:15058 stop:15885 length:828 start_codon:yes stop_codon:yes gene_type:complete
MTILTFDHLIKEELYKTVKKEFLKGDEKYRALRFDEANIEIDLNLDTINTFKEKVISIHKIKSKSIDHHTKEEIEIEDEIYNTEIEEITLGFTTDFLIPHISEFPGLYKNSFLKELKSRNLYSNSGVENFSKTRLKQLNEIRIAIENSNHLVQVVKDAALKSLDEIYEYISNDFYQKHINIPTKIPFNLNRNQVVGLFYLLYENEYISSEISPNDLFRLIEETCLYYDTKMNTHKAIIESNKLRRSLFGPNPEKSSQTTIDELQRIFEDKDFFSL